MVAKIKVEDSFRISGYKRVEVSDYIKNQLDGCDYDRGQIEAVEATANNAAEALGFLVDKLRERDLLTDEDVIDIGRVGY